MTIEGSIRELSGDGTFYSLTVVMGAPADTGDITRQTTHTHTPPPPPTGSCQTVKCE